MGYQYSILRKKLQAGIMISMAAFTLSGCAGQGQEMEEPEPVMESPQAEEQEEAEADVEETVNAGGESAEDDVETIEADEANIADDMENVETDRESAEDNTETSETDEEDEWNVDFEVIGAEYIYDEQRNEIEIYYPQLCGLEDSEKEERINALIEEDVMQIVGEKNKEGDDSLYCIDFDYEIEFANERMVSILYKGWNGYVTSGHSALSREAIATTIDIEEEKVITLQDVVTDLRELSNMLLADELEEITMWEGEATGYPFSGEFNGTVDELEENLRETPQEWYTDGENFIFINMDWRYYNEYSISIESVAHILDAGFLRKLE